MSTTYKLPVDANLVPSNQTGVYWFGLTIPAPHELGLEATNSAEEQSKGRRALSTLLDRFSRVYCDSELVGQIRDVKHPHLAIAMDVVATACRLTKPSEFLDPWLNSTNGNDAASLLSALRAISASLPPIYVGLAYQQSLLDRLNDHLDGRSNLRSHLSRTGLDWQDLYFTCVEIQTLDKRSYRVLEMTLQSLYRPVFSHR
jgi:hypothetical protein